MLSSWTELLQIGTGDGGSLPGSRLGPPLLLAIVVRPDGPKTVADLKGKTVSMSTAGSLTYWLVSETSRRQGWGPRICCLTWPRSATRATSRPC